MSCQIAEMEILQLVVQGLREFGSSRLSDLDVANSDRMLGRLREMSLYAYGCRYPDQYKASSIPGSVDYRQFDYYLRASLIRERDNTIRDRQQIADIHEAAKYLDYQCAEGDTESVYSLESKFLKELISLTMSELIKFVPEVAVANSKVYAF